MILVTGATGFVGGHVVHELRAQSRDVRALVRDPTAKSARTLATRGVELVRGDVTDAASLRQAVAGVDTVIHLVSIIASPSPEPFERVMKQGTRGLVAAAKDAGVRRFVLMSALGVNEESRDLVPYYGAKWDMEQTVKESGLDYVIFRPSFVFGKDGGVLPMFIRQVRLAPVTPVAGNGLRRLQPIWADDVARFFAAAVDHEGAAGRTFDLAGPDRLTWNEFISKIRGALGVKRRPTLHMPMSLLRLGATVVERLPKAPLTRDQLTMLEDADNVGDPGPSLETFGVEPIGIDEQLRRAVA